MRAGGTVRKVKKPKTLNTKVKRNVLLQEKNTESYSMSSCDILYTAEAELIKKSLNQTVTAQTAQNHLQLMIKSPPKDRAKQKCPLAPKAAIVHYGISITLNCCICVSNADMQGNSTISNSLLDYTPSIK